MLRAVTRCYALLLVGARYARTSQLRLTHPSGTTVLMSDSAQPELTTEDWEMIRSVGRRVRACQLEAFTSQGKGCGWCAHPIRIRGVVFDDNGEERSVRFSTASLPDGVTLKACGTRHEARCPACASVYRADARHLVRAGLLGGKGVDEAVATHPALFTTFTAPSFGAVHTAADGPCHPGRTGSRCRHGLPRTCFDRHRTEDEVVGSPLCSDCYDYEGAVLQNACTPELWRRTTIYLVRHLATALGLTQAQTRALCSLAFCRVAEFQRRGVAHIHAVIRADGPGRTPPPLEAGQLAGAAVSAARAVRVVHPYGTARWGEQLDVRILQRDEGQAEETARYVAKYSTKGAVEGGVLDMPIRHELDLAGRRLSPHYRRMVETAWSLGAEAACECMQLRRHAHTLGYGGHFLSKSRGYSTSLRALRAARASWQDVRRNGRDTTGDLSLTRELRAVGAGWADQGEAWWAEHQQRQQAEERKLANEERYSMSVDEWEAMP